MVVMDWGEAKADFTTVIDNAFCRRYMAVAYLSLSAATALSGVTFPGPLERTGAGRFRQAWRKPWRRRADQRRTTASVQG